MQEVGLVKVFNYSNVYELEELLVPALIFSIQDKPENYYSPSDKIIVPLVKEVIESNFPVPGRGN